MAKRRQRRKAEKERRHAETPAVVPRARDLEMTSRVKRLACTRKQAAEALGVSLATLDRRVIPAIETVRTEWGSRLIPVDELERYLAERRQEAPAAPAPGASWSQARARAGGGSAHPQRVRERACPRRDRTTTQRRRRPNVARRPPVVAVDSARRPRPLASAGLR